MGNNFNIANRITLARVALIPLFLLIIYIDKPWSDLIGMLIFTAISLTDILDGYLARKYNLVTDLGKILDPIADKILVVAAMIALVELGRLSGWIVIFILSRDFIVGALRNLSASKGIIIPAGIWGKLKTIVQMVAVGMITYNNKLFGIDCFKLGTVIIYISLILSVYSGYIYYKDYINIIKKK